MEYVFKKPLYKLTIPVFDAIGSILFFPSRFFKKKLPSHPKNILIVRLDHIGDFVCTSPLFKNLKKLFPEAKITVLVNSVSKELAYRNPNIDKVITYSPLWLARNERSSTFKGLARIIRDVRALNFDLGIEPRGDLLSIMIMWLGGVKYRIGYGITGGGFLLDGVCDYDKSKHTIERNLSLINLLGLSVTSDLPEIYFNENDKNAVDVIIRELSIKLDKAVVLHPFAGTKSKEWPRENFRKLIEWLNGDGWEIVLVGSKNDQGGFDRVADLRGRLNLPELACLISRIGFFIGLDSGPANMAAALNIPSVIICSGTNIPQLWIPKSEKVKFVYKDIDCRPCENKICPEENSCMITISVSDVIEAIEEIRV